MRTSPRPRALLILLTIVCSAIAKSAERSAVKEVRVTWLSGMCYGYCYHELVITKDRAEMTWSAFPEYKSRFPTITASRDVPSDIWNRLSALDEAEVKQQPSTIGCPGCVDEPIEGIEVRFADKTKKSVTFNCCRGPGPLGDVDDAIEPLRKKLDDEIKDEVQRDERTP